MAVIAGVTAYGFLLSLRPASLTFDSAPEEPLALVGVALANNIGTGIPRGNSIPVDLPRDVAVVQDAIMIDRIGWNDFFDEHFVRIAEFTEIANIDPVAYLRVHPDKTTALENYVSQLEESHADAKAAHASLTLLGDFHANAIQNIQTDIKNTQSAIEQAYTERNSDEIMSWIERLEELRISEQEHRNIVVFSKRFIAEYAALMTGVEKKIIVIKANAPALIQGITVKLPEWIDVNLLKDLQLFSTTN